MRVLVIALWVGLYWMGLGASDAPTRRDSDWLIRVGLEQGAFAPVLYVGVSADSLRWVDPRTGQTLGVGAAGQVWELRRENGRFVARCGQAQVASERLVAEPAGAGFAMVGASPNAMRPYRGHLEWVERDGKLLTVNWVRLDDYLKATLPREMPPHFHIESLKAQAVAARAFTMRRLNRYRQWGYDLCDHAPCQVYGGVNAEHPNTNLAVEATAGEVLTHGGRIVEAVYTGNCGGHTAPIEVAMTGTNAPTTLARRARHRRRRQAVLQPRAELRVGTDPHARGTRTTLPASWGAFGRSPIAQRTASGHVLQARLHGDRATLTLTGAEFRTAIGVGRVRSLMFEVQPQQGGWRIIGRGSGHGAGMCQWGAQGRALAGQTYRQILEAYYPDATLVGAFGQ
jgi:stage II sporulation protein D